MKKQRRSYVRPKNEHPQPRHPTKQEPGTKEKLAILRGRADRGEDLHHPKDAGLPEPPVSIPVVPSRLFRETVIEDDE